MHWTQRRVSIYDSAAASFRAASSSPLADVLGRLKHDGDLAGLAAEYRARLAASAVHDGRRRVLLDARDAAWKAANFPAFTPAGDFHGPRKSPVDVSWSRLVAFDIDHLGARCAEVKNAVFAVPSTAYAGLSAGGEGVHFAAAVDRSPVWLPEWTAVWLHVRHVLSADLPDLPDLIDVSVKDPARLRFMAPDPDLLVRETPAPIALPEPDELHDWAEGVKRDVKARGKMARAAARVEAAAHPAPGRKAPGKTPRTPDNPAHTPTRDAITAALAAGRFDPAVRKDWLSVAMSLKGLVCDGALAPGDAFGLWDDWSRVAPNYGAIRETWDSLGDGPFAWGPLIRRQAMQIAVDPDNSEIGNVRKPTAGPDNSEIGNVRKPTAGPDNSDPAAAPRPDVAGLLGLMADPHTDPLERTHAGLALARIADWHLDPSLGSLCGDVAVELAASSFRSRSLADAVLAPPDPTQPGADPWPSLLADDAPAAAAWAAAAHGLAYVDRTALLVGEPKSGKTTAVVHAAAGVASGRDWLTGAAAPAGRVLWIGGAGESSAADVKLIAASAGADDDALGRIHFLGARSTGEISAKLDAHPIPELGLIVIDTMRSFLSDSGGDANDGAENSSGAVRRVMAKLAGWIAAAPGCAGLAVHHSRRTDEGPGTLSRGSGDWTAAVDCVVEFRRAADSARKCWYAARLGGPSGTMTIRLESGAFRLLGGLQPGRGAGDEEADDNAVEAALREADGPLALPDLRRAWCDARGLRGLHGRGGIRFRAAVQRLADAGRIAADGPLDGQRNRSTRVRPAGRK